VPIVTARLSHSYSALPDVAGFPSRWQREFTLDALGRDPHAPHLDDHVSQALRFQGVWEAHETLAAIAVLERFGGVMLDFGAHIGWYSVLAKFFGDGQVIAWEDDAETQLALTDNAIRHDIDLELRGPVTRGMAPVEVDGPVSLVKVDIEGMDCWAIDACAGLFEHGRVAAALVEVSPIFEADGRGVCAYVELVGRLMGWGYRPFRVPPKGWDRLGAYRDAPLETLERWRGLGEDWAVEVARCRQDNFVFLRTQPYGHRS
jgi:hypothetical protein